MTYRIDTYAGDENGNLPVFEGDAENVLWVFYTFAGWHNNKSNYSVMMIA